MKFQIFKDASWPWNRRFDVEHFVALNIVCMKQSAFWPIQYGRYLPSALRFLEKPFQALYFAVAIVAAFHLAVLFFYSAYMKIVFRTPDIQLTDISDCLIQALIYLGCCVMYLYFGFNHKNCDEMVKYMDANFLRRSAAGLCYVTVEPVFWMARIITFVWCGLLVGGVLYISVQPILAGVWQLPLPQVLYPYDYQTVEMN